MKFAFYNAAFIVLLVLVVLLCSAIFLMFQVFLRPIGWALVVGTCLFPFKLMMTAYFRAYLQKGKASERPFSLTLALTPVHLIRSSASTLLGALRTTIFPLTMALVSTGTFLFMQEFGLFASLGFRISSLYLKVAHFFCRLSGLFGLRTALVLVATYGFIIYSKRIRLSYIQLSILQISIRFLLFNALASYFGFFQPVIMVGILGMTIDGRFLSQTESTELTSSIEENVSASTPGDIFRSYSNLSQSNIEDVPYQPFVPPTEDSSSNHSDPVWTNLGYNTSNPDDSSSALVRACFTSLALLHFAVAFWTRTWVFRFVLLALLIGSLAFIISYMQLIPMVLWILKLSLEYIKNAIRSSPIEPAPEHMDAVDGSSDVVSNESGEKGTTDRGVTEDYYNPSMDENKEEESLMNLVLPNHLKRSLTRIWKVERHLYDFVDEYLDYLISLVIIGMMVLITLLFTVFLMVQIYDETLNLISLSSSVLSSTAQSGAFSWLPDQDQLGSTARSAVSNVHQLGRTFIQSKVDELFHGNLSNKNDIEEHLLELWERVCMQFFHESNSTEALEPQHMIKSSFVLTEELAGGLNNATQSISLEVLKKRIHNLLFSFDGFDYHDLVAYFHENVGEIMNVVNPLWRLVSSHASFISSLLTGTASLLLTGGSVVLNSSFSILIFLSTLFYLLAASEQTYLPVDFIVSLTPQRGEASPVVLFFYASVEAAVASVVVTTLKRTIFYGMFTVLTHTLFSLDIVVLPSIIATILGAIPLMGTYWAVLPGVVELWCLRGSYWQALLLLLLHLLPWYFLDTELYTEIKG
nr:protocadherin 11 [Hymenolepis microstoma]